MAKIKTIDEFPASWAKALAAAVPGDGNLKDEKVRRDLVAAICAAAAHQWQALRYEADDAAEQRDAAQRQAVSLDAELKRVAAAWATAANDLVEWQGMADAVGALPMFGRILERKRGKALAAKEKMEAELSQLTG